MITFLMGVMETLGAILMECGGEELGEAAPLEKARHRFIWLREDFNMNMDSCCSENLRNQPGIASI